MSNWEKVKYFFISIGSLIVALVGLVFYFKNKAEDSEVKAIMGETKGEDKQLKKQQDKIEKEIEKVEAQDDSKLTNQERADRWKK